MDNKEKTTFFGLTSFRNQRKKFGIKHEDRRKHFYTVGKTGMGKSNLMENMAIQDIQNGYGLAYVDPHGEGAEKLLDFIPPNRIKDVIFFNPADLDYPIAFNVMEKVDFKYRHLVANGLMGVFKKVWPDVWSARMEYILNNSILALLEYPDSTLLGVNRMLADPDYRAKVVAKVKDPIIKSFWLTEYSRYTQRYEIEATAAIQNKVGQFISNALIRNIIGQTKSTIDMRKIMDEEKILILDLSKGRIGEDNSRLLGALLITKLYLAAMSRVDIPEDERKDFYLYVDEFQNFATESFASILSESRKYRLCLTLGHQYISQMDEVVRDAVFGNVGTMSVFRVGAEDAEFLEKEFSPEFIAEDLCNLPRYNICLKLMINGVASHPFSAETLSPPTPTFQSNRDKIITASRERYSVKKELVEEKISRWTGTENVELILNKNVSNAALKNQENQSILYDAICSICGKATKVIFQPQKDKPVYCKSCFKKIQSAKAVKEGNFRVANNSQIQTQGKAISGEAEQFTATKDEKLNIENIPFHLPKNKDKEIKRKEINLFELKKALNESLTPLEKNKKDLKKDENMSKPFIAPENKENIDKDKQNSSGRAELPEGEQAPYGAGTTEQGKKGVINPGQKVNL